MRATGGGSGGGGGGGSEKLTFAVEVDGLALTVAHSDTTRREGRASWPAAGRSRRRWPGCRLALAMDVTERGRVDGVG
jgi:hypothetical protein